MIKQRIALSVVGISHAKLCGRVRTWDQCLSNMKENIIDPLNSMGELKTYITTYDHEYVQPLMEFYNPVKYNVSPLTGSNQLDTYIKSLSLMVDADVDLVVSTRFDILFKKSIADISFIYDKFNVLFREHGWEHVNFTCDNLFVFPHHMLKPLIKSIEVWKNTKPHPQTSIYGLHGVFHQMKTCVGEDSVNVVSSMNQRCHDNEFYFLPTVPRN